MARQKGDKGGTNGQTTRTLPSGRVVRSGQEKAINIRIGKEELERYNMCVVLDAKLHGEDVNGASVLRRLIRQYCDRIETTSASEQGQQAAKVLRKRRAA